MTDPVHEAARAFIAAWDARWSPATANDVDLAIGALREALTTAAHSDAQALAAPAVGKYRTGQPETAQKAATAVRLRTGTQRHRVLAELARCGRTGATDYELSVRLRMIRHVAGTRRGELQRLGLVAPIGPPRPTDTGHDAEVYVITRRGVAALGVLARTGNVLVTP